MTVAATNRSVLSFRARLILHTLMFSCQFEAIVACQTVVISLIVTCGTVLITTGTRIPKGNKQQKFHRIINAEIGIDFD